MCLFRLLFVILFNNLFMCCVDVVCGRDDSGFLCDVSVFLRAASMILFVIKLVILFVLVVL